MSFLRTNYALHNCKSQARYLLFIALQNQRKSYNQSQSQYWLINKSFYNTDGSSGLQSHTDFASVARFTSSWYGSQTSTEDFKKRSKRVDLHFATLWSSGSRVAV
jgi:hypothetical protein